MDRATGQRYFATSAIHKSDFELSIGLFQVNLKSKDVKVHWDRVPGTSEQEKIAWLQNPYNNALFAYWVYTTSGWTPWSVYKDGAYLACHEPH